MGIDIFSIHLDKPSRQYSSGENVSGKVFIRISDVAETTSEITIRFFGVADTHWEENHYNNNNYNDNDNYYKYRNGYRRIIHYEGHENLFDFTVRLFGDGETRLQIPVGDNVFPFTFQVPPRPLPVTCSINWGRVCYGLEGCIKRPWFKFDEKTEILPVTIWTVVDLNITSGAGNPMEVSDSRTFGCSCCPTKPCLLKSFTPKLGYCPGEVIPFDVEFQNQSNSQIVEITATLTQVWTIFAYRDGGGTMYQRTDPVALDALGHSKIGPGESTKWEMDFTLPPTVPPTPPPGACKIIDMEYVINVKAFSNGCCCYDRFGLCHPIIVGTIPLTGTPSVVRQQEIPRYNNEKGGLA